MEMFRRHLIWVQGVQFGLENLFIVFFVVRGYIFWIYLGFLYR